MDNQFDEYVKRLVTLWEMPLGKPREYYQQDVYTLLRSFAQNEYIELFDELEARGVIKCNEHSRWYLNSKYLPHTEEKQNVSPVKKNDTSELYWKDFRLLLDYYIKCVEADDRSEYYVNTDKENDIFYAPTSMDYGWLQNIDEQPQLLKLSIPQAAGHIYGALMQSINKNNKLVYIGYPLHAAVARESRGAYRYYPLAMVPVRFVDSVSASRVSFGSFDVHIQLDFSEAIYNYEWIKRNVADEDQQELVDNLAKQASRHSASAFFDMKEGIMLMLSYSKYRDVPINPNQLSQVDPYELRKSTVLNKLIVFIAEPTRYNNNLITELKVIRNASASELDQTALAYIYRTPRLNTQIALDACVIPFNESNFEQLDAVESALCSGLSLLQGPPGTGKSQVAVNTIANCAFTGQSVLFSSKNNAALNAIRDRATKLLATDGSKPLVTFVNDENGNKSGWEKLGILDASNNVYSYSSDLDRISYQEVGNSAQRILEISRIKKRNEELTAEYMHTEKEYDSVIEDLDGKLAGSGIHDTYINEIKEIKAMGRIIIRGAGNGIFCRLYRFIHRRTFGNAISLYRGRYGLVPLSRQKPSFAGDKEIALGVIGDLERYTSAYMDLERARDKYEKKIDKGDYSEEYGRADGIIKDKALKALLYKLHIQALLSEDEVKAFNNAQAADNPILNCNDELRFAIHVLHKVQPAWCAGLLSLHYAAPMLPACFDIAVIDEASQCDPVSMIPALFRSKRAMIIGDPEQFKPITSITRKRDLMLMKESFGNSKDIPYSFSYSNHSAYDIVAQVVSSKMLKSHFRCESGIASFFNEAFYNGELRVFTSSAKLNFPICLADRSSFQWRDVKDGLAKQIETAVTISHQIIESGYTGTIGIISPLSAVVTDIQNACTRIGITANPKLKIATAYGFQGGECDTIIFVSAYTPDMRRGAAWYCTAVENRNIYNVAVSRAIACFIMIGDRDYCRRSNSTMLKLLASYPREIGLHKGSESIWEERLYNALLKRGIEVVQQKPCAGYFLDMSYEDENTKLDIEVDGYAYHFTNDGRRKISDYRRDMNLERLGWTILRFLPSQLHREMDRCIDTIESKIKGAYVIAGYNSDEFLMSSYERKVYRGFKSAGYELSYMRTILGHRVPFSYDSGNVKFAIVMYENTSLKMKSDLEQDGWIIYVMNRDEIKNNPQKIISTLLSELDKHT